MDVSFQGIKNVSYFRHNPNSYTYLSHVKDVIQTRGELLESYDIGMDRIILQLNDRGKKDLSNFKKTFPNILEKNLLRIDIVDLKESQDGLAVQDELLKNSQATKPERLFFINSNQVEIKDKNLKLLSTLAKMLKNISKDKAKIQPGNHFINSDGFFDNLTSQVNRYPMPLPDSPNMSIMGAILFQPEQTKLMSKKMNNKLSESILDFVS